MAGQYAGAEGDLSSLEELLQCAICMESFTVPKKLQCDHTFCEKCLQDLYNASGQSRNLRCPTCRTVTSVPANGIAGLRDDFRMNEMKDRIGRMKTRNCPQDNVCYKCQFVTAAWYCTMCEWKYCEGCMHTHNRNPLFNRHKVLTLRPLQNSTFTCRTCKVHKAKERSYFCQTCQAVACALCVMEAHSEHDVKDADVLFKQNMDDIRDLQKTIDVKVKRQRDVKMKFKTMRQQILQLYQQTKVGIKEKAAKMIRSIQIQEADLLRNLQQKRDQELGSLSKKLDNVESYLANAQCLKDDVATSNQIDKLAVHDTLKQHMRVLVGSNETMCSGERSLAVNFLAGQQEPIVGCLEVVQRSKANNSRDMQGAVQKKKPSSSAKDNAPVRMVKITGLTPETSTARIKMFVENKSGESELESCDFDADTGVAVIEFKSPQGATKLMNAGRLKLKDAQLTVTALSDIYAGLERESCRPKAVIVSGIGSQTSRDFLTVFFENRHRSGGGDIEYLEYDDEDGIAVITFEEADSASRVAQKASLLVDDAQVQVKLMRPSMHQVDVHGPFEDDTFLLSRVSSKCTGDDLKRFFLTSDFDSEIQQVTFTQEPGVVMLRFAYPPPEFYSLRELCVTKPLRGSMVSVQRVAQTRTIQVHNIGNFTEEVLRLYFENKKKSGGKTVTDLKIYAEEDYAVLDVADNSTVRSILARRNHSFDNQTLYVAAFYDSVGIIPPRRF